MSFFAGRLTIGAYEREGRFGNLQFRIANVTDPFHRPMIDIHVLITPRVMLLDLAGISDTLRLAVELGASYNIHYVGPAPKAGSSIGLTLSGIARLPESLPAGATVIVPGATQAVVDYRSAEARQAIDWLANTVTSAHRLCTVCSGAFLAARAGLLRHKTCTTHHSLTARLTPE